MPLTDQQIADMYGRAAMARGRDADPMAQVNFLHFGPDDVQALAGEVERLKREFRTLDGRRDKHLLTLLFLSGMLAGFACTIAGIALAGRI